MSKSAVALISVFGLFAALAHFLPLLDLFNGILSPELTIATSNHDFANYWIAGNLTLSGQHYDLFFQDRYFTHLIQTFGTDYPIHNWSYPPHFLLLLWPLGFTSFKVGLSIFVVVTFVCFIFSAELCRRHLGSEIRPLHLWVALSGYILVVLATTQNGFLTASLLLLGLTWMKERPALSGLAFAFLTIKPQLGFLVPLLLLLDRSWTTIAWSTLFTFALIALSALFFGLESWHAYFSETLAYQKSVMTDWHGIFLRMMPTAFGSLRSLGFSASTSFIAQWLVSIAGVALVLHFLLRESDTLKRMYVITCGTFLITPYAFNYDMGALSTIAALLFGSGRFNALPRTSFIAALVAVLPATITNLGRSNLPIAPFILMMSLLLIGNARISPEDSLRRPTQL